MDTILVNGNVITMAGPNKREQAVAVSDGKIVRVGDSRTALAGANANTRVFDLQGKTVLPGLTDSHMHCFITGLSLVSARLGDATSIQDVCERVREAARHAEPDAWVYALGCQPWALAERRYPSMEELDAVAPRNPVYIAAATFHSGATNSRGFELINPDLAEPGVGKDEAGRPSGSFLSDVTHFRAAGVAYGALSNDEIASLYKSAAEFAASRGVTTLHCLDGQFIDGDRDVFVLLETSHLLPVHMHVMYQTMDVQRVLELGLPRIGGCLTIDGAGFDHTALMYEPYTDAPWTCGDCYIEESQVRSFIKEAHEAGLQIGMHAIGDRAVDILVRAYAEAMDAFPRDDCRHRAEHFYLPSEWAIDEAARLGLVLPMQPVFPWLWDRDEDLDYERFWGRQRADRAEPFARLIERGMVVCGGSDSPVTEVDPLLGVHAAANHPHPARRVSVENALRMFTVNAAYAEFHEHEKGSLEDGKQADLVVVDRDPFLDTEHIRESVVELTMKAGEVSYLREGGALERST
jgi:predicted amidohydrolase YtcJ